jgi:hypothetical protein
MTSAGSVIYDMEEYSSDEEDDDEDDDDEENEDEFTPKLERLLRPAVIRMTCNKCRQHIHIITRSNPRFNKQQQQQQQQLLQQQHSPRSTSFLRKTTVIKAASTSPTNSPLSLQQQQQHQSLPSSPSLPSIQYNHKKSLLVNLPYQLIPDDEYNEYNYYIMNKLYDYVIDHVPNVDNELCVECLELLISDKEKEWQAMNQETQSYDSFINNNTNTNTNTNNNNNHQHQHQHQLLGNELENDELFLLQQFKMLEQQEEEWKLKISELQTEEAHLDHMESILKEEESKLTNLEQKYWTQYNEFQLKLNSFQQERYVWISIYRSMILTQ